MDSLRGVEGFGVSGKAAKQSRRSEGVDESLTWKMMMMTRRRMLPQDDDDDDDDHSRPFAPLNQANIAHDPTSNSNGRPKPSISIPSPAGAGAGEGEFWLQPFQFDISSSTIPHTHTPFKSPEVMSLEFPFTRAQWKELERQALIYKYMVASLPVPPHLLTLITKSPHDPAASQAPPGNGLNLRLSGRGGDAEPGRCRRTDGKKWRCSRDVAPDQKYCERHMHRGRPRSRKHVELLTKKINRHSNPSTDPHSSPSPSAIDFTNSTAPASHPFVSNLAQTSYQNQASEKAAIFGCMVPSVISSHKEPRGLEWVMNGEPIPLHDHNETLRLNSLASFSSGEDQQTSNTWPLFFNPDTAPLSYSDRGFIDAWSGATATDDTTPDLCGRNSVSSSGGLCPSPLSLTVGGKDAIDDDNGVSGQHGIIDAKSSDLTHWLAPSSWSASSAGGPLAEVLRPRKPAAADVALSDPASPVAGKGISCSTSAVTAGSSPSGVLQRGGALSLSDSSGSDSPTPGGSGANSDIGLVWLSHGKLASSS